MINKDFRKMGNSHNGFFGFRKHVRLTLSFRHALWVKIIFLCLCFYEGNFYGPKNSNSTKILIVKELQRLEFMRIVEAKMEEMTGEQSRKEPVGEVEKWKKKGKAWKKLEKGGVANYFGKLHGFDPEVTNNLVNSWKDDKVKVNGVSFQIIEEVFAKVIGIQMEGFKFYRDKKLSSNVVKDFVKNSAGTNKLIKSETFYVTESIKKIYKYVLRAIIEYVTLEPWFDRVRTHHFVILNHFHHNSKISFPYYLFTSMNKAITSYKKKATINPALHEGLLLLIHEHFKAQKISNNPL